MRVMTSYIFDRWTRGAGIVALVALVWAVVVPGGVFWTAILAASVIGASVATAVLVRTRSIPSLAQVIASAEAEPAVVSASGGYTSEARTRGGCGHRAAPMHRHLTTD